MADQQQDNSMQFLLSDLGTRIRDLEEKTSSLKEKTQMLSSNTLDTKEQLEIRTLHIEKQNTQILNDLKKINSQLQSISSEMNNFVRRDEIILVERMLKDFQPLEFMRRKDFEEFLKERQSQKIDKKENNKE
jgi:hypothetical protein